MSGAITKVESKENKKWKLQFAWFPTVLIAYFYFLIKDYDYGIFRYIVFGLLMGILLTALINRVPLLEIVVLTLVKLPNTFFSVTLITKAAIFIIAFIGIGGGVLFGLLILMCIKKTKLDIKFKYYIYKNYLTNDKILSTERRVFIINKTLAAILLIISLFFVAFPSFAYPIFSISQFIIFIFVTTLDKVNKNYKTTFIGIAILIVLALIPFLYSNISALIGLIIIVCGVPTSIVLGIIAREKFEIFIYKLLKSINEGDI